MSIGLEVKPTSETRTGAYLTWTVLALVFALSCWQAPLYYSNQNQYFLHGVAAGSGDLHNDWLAGTADPTPVFTALVAFTIRWLHPAVFYVVYALLQGTYFVSLISLAEKIGGDVLRRRRLLLGAMLILAHAGVLRWASFRWLGQDYPWFLQAGVAGQYVLGAALQPSAFGVLLVASIAFFAYERSLMAAVCAGLAPVFHATYLLPAALLVAAYMIVLSRERRWWRSLMVGGVPLLMVLPIIIYIRTEFAPTDPYLFQAAEYVLIHDRIPHHCLVGQWLDVVAGLQLAWVVLAIALVWRQRLFLVLAIPAVLAIGLTLFQIATDDWTLALLFPWRISSVLVPVATAVVLAWLVWALPESLAGTGARAVAVLVLGLCLAGGVWLGWTRQCFYTDDNELPLFDFVRRSHQPGDVVFVPVTVPDPKKAKRGSLSTDFQPLQSKKQDVRAIPVDLQRFRLATRTAIYVDFKSVPYRDVDVLEWHRRIKETEPIQASLRDGNTGSALARLRQEGVTHLVWPANQPLTGEGLQEIYRDEMYRVYRITDK